MRSKREGLCPTHSYLAIASRPGSTRESRRCVLNLRGFVSSTHQVAGVLVINIVYHIQGEKVYNILIF